MGDREPCGDVGRVVIAVFIFTFQSPRKKAKQTKTCVEFSRKDTLAKLVISRYARMMRFCLAAKFTEFPRNVTATEGQNVEMSCAFQSGSASVYLEIQWWFLRGPEDLEHGTEAAGSQVAMT